MLKFKDILFSGLILILATSFSYAQWHHPDFEHRREKMEKFRTWEMTKFLDLTPEQSQKFFPELNKFEKEMFNNRIEVKNLIDTIEAKLDQENYQPSHQDYKKYKSKFIELEKERISKRKNFLDNLDDILNTEQKIKYLIFDDKFKHDIMRKLRDRHFPDKRDKRK
ncbi:MAG: hypothetical protein K9N00_00765 [Candidatus Marinimicrobia bacterium]|nr:hypothetical protein [Candidatus Neomarinimicrobiota bacterium]